MTARACSFKQVINSDHGLEILPCRTSKEQSGSTTRGFRNTLNVDSSRLSSGFSTANTGTNSIEQHGETLVREVRGSIDTARRGLHGMAHQLGAL